MDNNLLIIGKVLKPHGVEGKLKVLNYTDSPDVFHYADQLYLKEGNGTMTPLHLKSVSSHKMNMILDVDEIENIERAEETRGCHILIDKAKLKKLPDGEYYQYELIGLDVISVSGKKFGKIKELISTGSNDVFIVREGKQEHLVPALKDIIKKIDFEKRQIIIEPIDGMMEQDEV